MPGSSPALRHQRVEGQLHARRRVALEHEDVQRVEGLRILVVGPVRRLEVIRPPLGAVAST